MLLIIQNCFKNILKSLFWRLKRKFVDIIFALYKFLQEKFVNNYDDYFHRTSKTLQSRNLAFIRDRLEFEMNVSVGHSLFRMAII